MILLGIILGIDFLFVMAFMPLICSLDGKHAKGVNTVLVIGCTFIVLQLLFLAGVSAMSGNDSGGNTGFHGITEP